MRRASSAGLRNDTIQRTTSDAGTSSSGGSTAKMWRLGSALKRLGSINASSKDEKMAIHKQGPLADTEYREPSIAEKESIHESTESSYRQLQILVARMRSSPSGPNHIDGAYKEFFKIREQCTGLCQSILQEEIKSPRTASNATETLHLNRETSLDAPRSPGPMYDQRSSFSGRSLAEVVTGSGSRGGGYGGDAWLNPIREWKNCLETLTQSFKTHLAETYKTYERDATPEMVEALFSSKKFRKDAVHRMRNASVTKIMSADPQFFPRYEIRFRNYEKVKQDLMDIRRLLQAGESGISPNRVIEEFPIAPRGDVILEFANLSPDATGNEPALRFRVSSPLLAETSPIFARMFGGHPNSHFVHDAEDISGQLPPPPVQYFCEDGSEVRLYRMPQHELNKLSSLEILLHAAHNHSEKLDKEVTFEEFVTIAECCMRYKCTSPLELIVENRWLPQWMHKGADDMPDGLLIISYAFGLRQLFTRMSKSAILNLVDEKDLHSKPWPQKVRDKIWAVRCAKVDQLYASCTSTIQDYLRPPTRDLVTDTDPVSLNELDSRLSSPVQPMTTLSSIPRCPKGSHWCDASNLGWMMLVYSEMGLLPYVLRPDALSHLPKIEPPRKSLAQMMDMLRLAPSPSAPVHPGSVCDPAPSFRAAVADIYNSVTGLTLFDISGRSHGWALSKHKTSEPQMLLATGLDRMATHDNVFSVVTEFPEDVRFRILSEISDLRDLHAAARINRGFYQTYKQHELQLMRNILRADRIKYGTLRPSSLEEGDMEGKVLKSESDKLKERGFGEGADVITLRSEDDDGELSDSDDDESIDDTDTIHDDDELFTRDPPPPFRSQDSDPPPPPPPIHRHNSSSDRSKTPDGSDDLASPATPRQAPFIPANQPTATTLIPSDDMYEPPMTDEEARRILWPDHLDTSLPSQMAKLPPGVEGLREKFRLGDISFSEGLEAKTLVQPGEKQLRSDHDQRVGLSKDELLGKAQGMTETSG
ncbi:hypothetical protein PT974_10110 [Cladobotryum mycophilum]|uniref:F-box domain-containing protein n=1 Tax=Cladobotryum mycophilum TaxID=491253 RepID=A0ABR0S9G5_9HYPO